MTAAALLLLTAAAAADSSPVPVPGDWSSATFAGRDYGRPRAPADAAGSSLAAEGRGWNAQYGGTATPRPGRAGGAWTLGWRMERRIGRRWGAELGLGWSGWGDAIGSLSAAGASGETLAATERVTAAAVTLGAGAWGRTPDWRRWRLAVRAAAGPCWGSTSRLRSSSFSDPVNGIEASHDATATARGSGWHAEAAVEVERTAGSTAVFASAGIRWLLVADLRHARSADLDGDGLNEIVRGARLADGEGNPVSLSTRDALLSAGVRIGL